MFDISELVLWFGSLMKEDGQKWEDFENEICRLGPKPLELSRHEGKKVSGPFII